MNPQDDGLGLGWIAIGAAGFIVGYALAKLKVINEGNSSTFCIWASGILAAVVALAADVGAGSFTGLLGRIAVFLLVWVSCGIVFTIGVLLGVEKSGKSSK